nr:unnamed protein product [Digitaria exilis]
MELGRTNLTEAVRSVHLLKIDDYSGTSVMSSSDCIKSRWNVDGHDWEVHCFPRYGAATGSVHFLVLKLILVSEPQRDRFTASLSAKLVLDPSRNLDPSEEKSVSHVFGSGSGSEASSSELYLMSRENPRREQTSRLFLIPVIVFLPTKAFSPQDLLSSWSSYSAT